MGPAERRPPNLAAASVPIMCTLAAAFVVAGGEVTTRQASRPNTNQLQACHSLIYF